MKRLNPRNESDVVDIVSAALSNEMPLAITSGSTRTGYGRPATAEVGVSMASLSGITFYEPSELVMSVKPGTPLKVVSDTLAQHGQELAFEPMSHTGIYGATDQEDTIGGAVATNASGPRRIKVGSARDHLLGFQAVNGRGEIFKSGGRVMKNVTGYDLSKLMTGSCGTLGILTDVTLKVLPRAPTEKTVVAMGFDDVAAVHEMTRVTGWAAAGSVDTNLS